MKLLTKYLNKVRFIFELDGFVILIYPVNLKGDLTWAIWLFIRISDGLDHIGFSLFGI